MRVKRWCSYMKVGDGTKIRFGVTEYRGSNLLEIYTHTCASCDLKRIKKWISQHFTIPMSEINEELIEG